MMDLKLIEIDYLIADFSNHAYWLKQKRQDWRIHYQVITPKQLIEDLLFSFDRVSATLEVMQAFLVDFAEAEQWLKELNFLPPVNGHPSPEMNRLADVFNHLKQKGLLRLNPLGQHKYRYKKVMLSYEVMHHPQVHSLLQQMQADVVTIPMRDLSKDIPVYEFATIEDEVSHFFNQVAANLEKGMSLDQMILLEPDSSYEYELHRQSHYYQIPIQWPSQQSLYALPSIQNVMNEYQNSGHWNQDVINNEPLLNSKIRSQIKHVLDEKAFQKMAKAKQIHFLKKFLMDLKIPRIVYQSAVRVVPQHLPDSEECVFILGFIQGQYPKIIRDKAFLDNSIKRFLGLSTTTDQQTQWVNYFQAMMGLSHHHWISYPRMIEGQLSIPSPLIQQWHMRVYQGNFIVKGVDYSGQLGAIRKAQYQHLKRQFNLSHPYLEAYSNQYPDVQPFDYRFQSSPLIPVSKPLRLSYSAIKDYFQCGFKYFVGRVLKIKPLDQDEFYMHLGTFAHEVFETLTHESMSFDQVFDEILLQQKDLSAKERVLFANLKNQLRQVHQFNLFHQQHMHNPRFEMEKKMDYHHDQETSLVGYIDKIVLVSDAANQEYVSVVDYKSGSESFDEDLVPYGWSLQLPIYALMLRQHPQFKDKEILGVFIQHIIETSLNPKTITIENTMLPQRYQLDGIALDDPKKITHFDQSIQAGKSTFIEGLSITKSGEFKKSNHAKKSEDLTSLQTLAHQKITEASTGIRKRQFPINPKSIKNHSSCEHCPFIDVCFRQAKDIDIIPMKKPEVREDELD